MLDQNTDRMWYVIGAVLIGGLIIASSVLLFSDTVFAGIGSTFDSFLSSAGNPIPNHYVMATDDDFEWTTFESGSGRYQYIGDEEYVIIPDTIHGEKITSYYRMFSNSGSSIKGVASNNKNLTNIQSMFYKSKNKELDLSYFNTSSVTNMRSVFDKSEIEQLTLTNIDTSNVTLMHYLFQNSKIKVLDLSGFNFNKVTNFDNMLKDVRTEIIYVSSDEDMNLLKNSYKSTKSINYVIKN